MFFRNRINEIGVSSSYFKILPSILIVAILGVSLISSNYLPSYLWKEIVLLIGTGILILFTVLTGKRIVALPFNKIDWIVVLLFLYRSFNLYLQSKVIQAALFQMLLSICLLLFYLTVRMLFAAKQYTESKIENSVLIIFFAQVTLGLLQLLGVLSSMNSQFSVTGSFANSGTFANYLCILCAFVCPLLINSSKRKNNKFWFILVLFLIAVFLIFHSASRTAYIGLIVLFFFVLSKYIKEINRRWFIRLTIVSFLCLTIVLLFLTFGSIGFKEASALGRLLIWKLSLKMYSHYPFFGVGGSNFAVMYQSFQAKYFENNISSGRNIFSEIAGDTRFAFNDFLQLLCEDGVIGIAIFSYLIFFITKSIFQNKYLETSYNSVLFSIKGTLLTIFVCSFTSYGWSLIEFKVIILLMLAGYSSSCMFSKNTIRPIKKDWLVMFGGFWGIVFLSYGLLRGLALKDFSTYNSPSVLKEKECLIGDTPLYLMRLVELQVSENDLGNASKKLEELKLINPDKRIYYYLGQLYEKQGFYDLAERQYLNVYYTIPSLILPRFYLASMYLETKQFGKFENIAREALQMKLKIKSNEVMQLQNQIRELYLEYMKIFKKYK